MSNLNDFLQKDLHLANLQVSGLEVSNWFKNEDGVWDRDNSPMIVSGTASSTTLAGTTVLSGTEKHDGSYLITMDTGGGFFDVDGDLRLVPVAGSPLKTILACNYGNGILTLWDATQSDFNRIEFGGHSASYPAVKRNAAELQVRLADDSDYADLAASRGRFASGITVGLATVGTLPTASASAGEEFRVSDADSPVVGAGVNGGGSAGCKVISNGTDWIVTAIY